MAIPFEEKDEKIKVTCELGSGEEVTVQLPAELALDDQAGGKASDSSLNANVEGNIALSSRPVYTASPLVRAKKRRLSELLCLIVGILPVLTFLTVLVNDPAAIPFLKAEYFDGMTPKVIEDINRAYSARHGMDILAERARIYHLFGNHKKEAADYLVLLRNKVALKEMRPYAIAAEVLVEEKGATKEAITYLQRAIELSRPTSRLFGNFDLKGYLPYSRQDSDCLLQLYSESLFCGDQSTIQTLSKMKPEGSGLTDIGILFLQAQASRELGGDKECRQKLDLIDLGYYDSSHFGSIVHSFKALSQLDIGRIEAAATEIEQYSRQVAKAKQALVNRSLVNLTSAWILYSQGKYSEAYDRSVQADKIGPDDWTGISALQACAANRLLRSEILLKLGRVSEAHKELAAYRKSGCLGTSFIPKMYRGWISEAQAH